MNGVKMYGFLKTNEKVFVKISISMYFKNKMHVNFNSSRCSTRGRYLRVYDRIYHSTSNHCPTRTGRRSGSRVLLADGVPPSAEDVRPAAAPARVPQSTVHHAGARGRTLTRLPHVIT